MPYPQKRDISFWDNNSRAELLKALPIRYGAFYWSTDAFLFKDEWGNQFRNDSCLSPLYHYMKVYWKKSLTASDCKSDNVNDCSKSGSYLQSHPAVLKISGVTEDKIQFFSEADFISSDDSVVSLITDPDYKGDTIFLSPPDHNKKTEAVESHNDLSSDKRLRIPYRVERFDSNHLEITADLNNTETAWLFYSDVWHPGWRATVNGKEVPVYKANLAYKAVKLEKGFNTVHFYFKSGLMSVLYFIFGLNALCWMMIIFYLSGMIVVGNRRFNGTNFQK